VDEVEERIWWVDYRNPDLSVTASLGGHVSEAASETYCDQDRARWTLKSRTGQSWAAEVLLLKGAAF
jgi:hypothetical protein